MIRTQISLELDQARRLQRIATERGTSMAGLIRDAVDRVYPERDEDSLDARWGRALAAVGGGRSGFPDAAERHDDHLAEAYAE